jgi:hypothetical protein
MKQYSVKEYSMKQYCIYTYTHGRHRRHEHERSVHTTRINQRPATPQNHCSWERNGGEDVVREAFPLGAYCLVLPRIALCIASRKPVLMGSCVTLEVSWEVIAITEHGMECPAPGEPLSTPPSTCVHNAAERLSRVLPQVLPRENRY